MSGLVRRCHELRKIAWPPVRSVRSIRWLSPSPLCLPTALAFDIRCVGPRVITATENLVENWPQPIVRADKVPLIAACPFLIAPNTFPLNHESPRVLLSPILLDFRWVFGSLSRNIVDPIVRRESVKLDHTGYGPRW